MRERHNMKHIYNNSLLITFIKAEPFAYNVVYIICLNVMVFFNLTEFEYYVLNTLLFVSPVIVLSNIIKSRLANLCKYHRCAVFCPMIGYGFSFTNDYLYNYGEKTTYVIMCIILAMTLITIYSGIKVFKANERRKQRKYKTM